MSRSRRVQTLAVTLAVTLMGCGEGAAVVGSQSPQGPGGPNNAQDPREPAIALAPLEAVTIPAPMSDPEWMYPTDPIWHEFWVPIDDAQRDGMPFTHEILQMAAVQPGMTVADVGAGGGYYTFKFARAVGPTGHVYAVDILRHLAQRMAWQAQLRGVDNVTAIQTGGATPGVPTTSVDLVTIIDVGIF